MHCADGTLNASGSTAQANAMTQWIKDYQTACSGANDQLQRRRLRPGRHRLHQRADRVRRLRLGAQPGQGRARQGRTPAARPATPSTCRWSRARSPWSTTSQGVDKLTLTPVGARQIFSGKITKWNDPAIAALNPGAKLPDATISTVHRSDSSGTTDNFTKYLTAAAPSDWTYDHDKAVEGAGRPGRQGLGRRRGAVKQTPNTIAYVEYCFATQNGLSIAQIDNGGGAVELTPETVGKAVSAAKVTGTGDDLTLKLDYATKTPGAYPISW